MSEQNSQAQVQVQARQLIMEIKNCKTGSPVLYRRNIHVRFVTTPPVAEISASLINELQKMKYSIEELLGGYYRLDEPIVETRLEHMVLLASRNLLRPHSTRKFVFTWEIAGEEMKKIEAKIEVGYDPPVTVEIYLMPPKTGLAVTVNFYGKRTSCYKRSLATSPSILKPIDVLSLLLTLDALNIAIKTIKAWYIVGEKEAMMLRLQGGRYIVSVEYDPALLNQELRQEEQKEEQNQEQKAEDTSSSSTQSTST